MATCACGCGETTRLAPCSDKNKGWVRGRPLRYVVNHHRRKSGCEYVVQDRGFTSPCWIWQRAKARHGYGQALGSNGRVQSAYRVVYERLRGAIGPNMDLDHLCRVPECVNPDHLEPVTHAENCRRGASAKLTHDEVREIKKRLAHGRHGIGLQLAAEYGVHPATISDIRRGATWEEV